MGAPRWTLVFFCICLKAFETKASAWTATLPSSVQGLRGSCVVIPCTFSYPYPSKTPPVFTGIWMDNNGIIFHPIESQIQQGYRSRTKLLGEVANKNCSLKIDPLQLNDNGPFYFRIEIKDYDQYSYRGHMVKITVMNEPDPIQLLVKEEIKEKEAASASCSVSYSCPDTPPIFTWSHSGEEVHRSQQLNDHQLQVTSTLTFHPRPPDHNQPLWCNVTHQGGQKQNMFKILHVKYAPVNVKVEYESDVEEGRTVGLTCSSDANPPASSYEWQNETGEQIHQGNLYVVQSVSRHLGALFCTAINDEGRATSRPVRFNVSYAPEIKAESSCSSEDLWVTCECIVDSNPPSRVTFKLGDKILIGNNRQGDGSYTFRALQTEIESLKFVLCWANNTMGSSNLQLPFPADWTGMVLIIYVAAGAGALSLVVLIAVGVFIKCRGRTRDTEASNMSAMMTERAQEAPKWAATSRKETCDGTPRSEIDYNDHFYGNVGTNWDDPIYANVQPVEELPKSAWILQRQKIPQVFSK
nr:sialic acid-binding Ig-like lectin 7 isoform X1 [Nothobranchius furzeri]